MKNKIRNQKGFALIELLLIIMILIVAGGIGYLLFKKEKSVQEVDVQTKSSVVKEDVATATKKVAESQIVDCGTIVNFQKFDCFINAAKNCSLAKITATTQLDLFGLIAEGNTFYEIKGWQKNECLFYIKSMSSKVTFSQEFIQSLLDKGATKEQIKQQEEESSKISSSIVGRDGICKFTNANNLTILLNKWNEGNFSSDDFKNIDCKGEYFGQGEQSANISKTITDEQCGNQKGYLTPVSDTGTSCFKNQIDLGTVTGPVKMSGKYPQCCVQK